MKSFLGTTDVGGTAKAEFGRLTHPTISPAVEETLTIEQIAKRITELESDPSTDAVVAMHHTEQKEQYRAALSALKK